MSKGKVTVQFSATNYNDDLKFNMKVLLKRKLPGSMKEPDAKTFKFPVKKPFKKSGTYFAIISNKGKFQDFVMPERNKQSTMYIDEFEAEFIKAKTKAGDRYYHLVVVNLGTKENPILRSFYIDEDYINLATANKFQYEYPFTEVAEVSEDEDIEDDLEE